MKKEKIIVAVAGQPNSGKSTIFNLLTGARQHVANYPGVTVEKKTGIFKFKGDKIELVDLPGTYSLTSYTLEERIARDFILHERPKLIVDIVDASNLERNLYLTFQLGEIGIPLVIDLNMMDVAKNRGIEINIDELSRQLGVPVIPTIGNKGKGKKELQKAIWDVAKGNIKPNFRRIDYGNTLEPILSSLEKRLSEESVLSQNYPLRWLAVKLMEGDSEAERLVKEKSKNGKEIIDYVKNERERFISQYKETPEKVIAQRRYLTAEKIVESVIKRKKEVTLTLSDKIDKVVCHKVFGFIILAAVIYSLYELSIVQGYKITNYTWPILVSFRNFIAKILPPEGFIFDPFLRSLPLGVIDGIIAVLNYIPIFLILFTLIAILEDTGYMARMAFILDRIFRHFGLHGQSILPYILGGVYVGGCAIPGVMACRGIKDEKARMATILTVPLMNCMAKIPLYVLLIGMFFAKYKAFAMFFIATITLIIALGVAKVLNLTVLKRKESAPFVMELPPYHIPTISGVLRRCLERTWLFVRKVITVVIVVATIVYILISMPGISKERKAYYEKMANQAIERFYKEIGKENPYAKILAGEGLMEFTRYWDSYKTAMMRAKGKEEKRAIDEKFKAKNIEFYKIVKRGNYELDGKKIKDKNAKKVYKAYKKLAKVRKKLRREIKNETVMSSYLGRFGQAIEPFTKFAGFNWRINIALISSFAAKENAVATLGSIYQSPTGEEAQLGERMKREETGWTPLHALAIMLFMAMYPPCIPTLIMVRLETGSTKWMLFATIYPIILGLIIAILIFTGGNLLGLSGIQAMIAFYILAIICTAILGFVKREPKIT